MSNRMSAQDMARQVVEKWNNGTSERLIELIARAITHERGNGEQTSQLIQDVIAKNDAQYERIKVLEAELETLRKTREVGQ